MNSVLNFEFFNLSFPIPKVTYRHMSTELTEPRMESRSVSRFAGVRIHFIGIGGCGVSGLARMLLDAGAIVTGSEPKPNALTFDLVQRGVKISRDQMGELLVPKPDLVVRSAAVPDWNLEYKAALHQGVKAIKYAQMLGEVMTERFGIAVAGAHGKSTTTAMIGYALLRCGADPSVVVGGTVPQLEGGSRSGTGKHFVVEACEFDRSFHHLHPAGAVITNLDEEHFETYPGGIAEVIESFRVFAKLVPTEGWIIANGQDARAGLALEGAAAAVQWVGVIDEAREPGVSGGPSTALSWIARVLPNEKGCPCAELIHDGRRVGMLRLSIPGRHNLFNATMAVAACVAAGIDPAEAAAAVGEFTGVDRRMTEKGQYNGAIVLDDYGHHPTEIVATLEAIREKYNPSRLFCVFQPHQHSRTRYLLNDFAAAFSAATETIVPDIYFVRDSEAERERITSAELVERIIDHGQDARHISHLHLIAPYLREKLREGDVVVTMGAGNVWEIAQELVAGN
jgi:UDP-N-acetylmuramate--alanine ligase